jgi:signal transduction histidine kinase
MPKRASSDCTKSSINLRWNNPVLGELAAHARLRSRGSFMDGTAQARAIPMPTGGGPFPTGGGEMGARIRAMDWSTTPIGPIESWSPSLRMMVSLLLANRFPLLLWWGPHYVSIYNDAYRPILGTKHPKALGQPVRECWSEIWHVLKPLIDSPFTGGPATWMEDLPLEVNRYGFTEETHFTIAYSPVPDETTQRGIGGVLATVHEITDKVVGERRVVILRDLGARAAQPKTAEEACAVAADVLSNHASSVPFSLLYLIDDGGRQAHLAGVAGVERGEAVSPISVPLDASGASAAWPLAEAMRREDIIVVDSLAARFPRLKPGPWSDPPHCAVVVPVRSNKAHQLAGLMVAGVSPRLRLDHLYRSFFDLAAAQIATSIANARAYQDERKRAEGLAEIDRAKTAFFSNVSHEFRTPLTLMLGPLEEVLAVPADALPQRRDDLALVHRSGLRLLRLVNTLLDFSRIEAGRVEASYEPVDLATFCADLASEFRAATEKAGLRLTVDCPPLTAPVWIDRSMWEKIVLNLLSNAFKFTLEGGIMVRLRKQDGSAVLAVEDTGIGIPADQLPRIFERFHRVEGAHGRTHEGTGIGLALVQELAKLHGGTARADSILGVGSTFTVTVPLGMTHLPADRLRAERSLASTTLGARPYVEEALRWLPGGAGQSASEFDVTRELLPEQPSPAADVGERATVLVVDDNADMREYVRRLLAPYYEVHTACDGAAALAAIRTHRPDLLLSDVMMPLLDGFGLVREIRADPLIADLPIILLSARAGEEASVEGIEAGADDYLIKPFSARELIARVTGNLKVRRAIAQSEKRLRELNELLERKVEERSRALEAEMAERHKMQAALHQYQRLEAIGRLTGGVAHDFNNLLMVVIGQAERIAAAAEGNRRIMQMAEAVRRAGERGSQLTQQLLSFSGRQQLRPVTFAMDRLIRSVGDLVRRTIGEAISVTISIDSELWPLHADPAQLESAILNLAINARDAMPGGGRLLIAGRNTTVMSDTAERLGVPPGEYVVTSVTDTGIGMTAEVQQRAFEPFYTTKKIGKGTGLGLSQIYGFVRQSGGTATIESAPDQGTTVALYLPRSHESVPDDTPSSEQHEVPAGDGKTLLIVEDQADVRDTVTAWLADLGYRILTASDGVAARTILESRETVDLLLTDVVMPNGVSGLELAREARRLRQDIKIVAISGYLDPTHIPGTDIADLIFLEKPAQPTKLAETIAAALAAKTRRRQHFG